MKLRSFIGFALLLTSIPATGASEEEPSDDYFNRSAVAIVGNAAHLVSVLGSRISCVNQYEYSGVERVAAELFAGLEPCQIYELMFPDGLLHSLHIDLSASMPIEEVERLASDLAWKGRFSKYFHPSPTIARYQLKETIRRLIRVMQEQSVESIRFGDLKWLSEIEFDRLKSANEIGECYTIQLYEKPMLASKKAIGISAAVQSEIENLFHNPSSLELTGNEIRLKSEGVSLSEIHELRAIRKATEIFESHSPLKGDKQGGFFSNLRAELTGGNQMTCNEESVSMYYFLKKLEDKGLLNHFEVVGYVSKRQRIQVGPLGLPDPMNDVAGSGHLAVKIISKNIDSEYVVDSWYEEGGTAAHILTVEDWNRLPVSGLKKPRFNDVVPVIP